MKLLFISFLCFTCMHCAVMRMPTYLQQFTCRKSEPEYAKCIWNGFENTRSYFVKGIPELGVPPLDPFHMDSFSVNRTLNQLISINAVCRNVEVTGMKNTVIVGLKADPINHYGEVRLTIPWTYLEMDYDVKGQLLIIPLDNSGHFKGNFTDTQMFIKGTLKPYVKDGIEYFKTGRLALKITIGNGHVELSSKNKEMQYAADLINDFFNENPRRVLDAINPIFIEFSRSFARQEFDRVLAMLPANEWVPE